MEALTSRKGFCYVFCDTFNIDIQLVCYTAVFSVVIQRISPLIEPHSFSAISQLESCSHFLGETEKRVRS